MKYFIQGALDQLSTKVNPLGLVEHYLWGFEGDYDSRVWISEETYERIRRFLLEETGNILPDIDGFMADDHEDGDGIPFGARVIVCLWMEDRHAEESPWYFAIERASDSSAAA